MRCNVYNLRTYAVSNVAGTGWQPILLPLVYILTLAVKQQIDKALRWPIFPCPQCGSKLPRHVNSLNIFRIPANENAKEASLVFSRDGSQGETSFAEFVMK
jgi:hypothetical protein